jgi:uncharacterized protein YgiM (DUF1202 family)
MRFQARVPILVVLAAAVLVGCSNGAAGTQTLSADEVIATAQAAALATRGAITPTATPTPVTPSPTVPVATATPTLAPTSEIPIGTAAYNANVRSGPGVEYESVDGFYQGQTAELIGRTVNALGETWWLLRRIGSGLNGWVWDRAIVVSGDVSGVPNLEPPASPTPTP